MRAVARLAGTALILAASPLLAEGDTVSVFEEANGYFAAGSDLLSSDPQQAALEFRRAALRYESLLGDHGVVSAKLHYNLANAYFRLGDLGRSILHYRQALRLDPTDQDALRNLEYARTTRRDRLEAAPGSQVLETLLFWHYDLSIAGRLRLFAALWVLAWGILLLRLLGRAWVPREIAVASGVVAVLMLGSLVVEAVQDRAASGVITALECVARQGDGNGYDPAFEEPLHAGAEFLLLEERSEWYRVQLPDGRRCWLPAADVELVR